MANVLYSGIARKLILHVPDRLGGMTIEASEESLRKSVDMIPGAWEMVDFRSDVWDFSPYFKMVQTYMHTFRFVNYPEQIRDALKDFIVAMIDRPGEKRRGKIRTIYATVGAVSAIFKKLLQKTGGMIDEITAEDVLELIEGKNAKTASDRLCKFLKFIEITSACGHVWYLDRGSLKERLKTYMDIAKFIQTIHHQDIPEPYFDHIIKRMDAVMRDESLSFNARITAGIILIQSQLGLRIGELCALKTDCLHWYNCSDGKKRPYIVYSSIKEAHWKNESFLVSTICTPLLLRTLKYYIPLRNQGPYAGMTDFLLVFGPRPGEKKGVKKFPEQNSVLNDWRKRVIIRYCPFAQKEWKGISQSVMKKFGGKAYSIPTMHNFRVHFATSLFEQGMPLDFIESMMSHSYGSNTFDAYYARTKPKRKLHETVHLREQAYDDLFDDLTLVP